MKRGKKYQDAVKAYDRSAQYDVAEAIDLVKKNATAKFDETIEAHFRLGVDGRHADQQVRGAVVLPNGTGKDVRVLAICKGENEQLAKDAGADFVGAEDMTQKIQQENWMDFDVLVTTPDCMGLVGRLGRILGPRGLMPNPKAGTVTPDIAKAIKEAKAGKIEYRLDKTNIIHCPIGKASFGAEKRRDCTGRLLCGLPRHHPRRGQQRAKNARNAARSRANGRKKAVPASHGSAGRVQAAALPPPGVFRAAGAGAGH